MRKKKRWQKARKLSRRRRKAAVPSIGGMTSALYLGRFVIPSTASSAGGGDTSWRIVADAKAQDGTAYGKLVEFSPKINQPFLYPALDAEREAIKKNIVEAVKTALRREGR